MPPKKKGGKGKKKKAVSKDAGEIVSPEDQICILQSQTSSLEFQLACKAEETTELRAALAEANKKHEEEKQMNEKVKQMTADISATMTRQFKGMQHELLEKIAERERILASKEDELIEAQKVATEQLAAKDRIIQQKDEEAAICRQEIEDLCKHFADLFAEASEQISSIM